jgi:endoglucanase
MTRTIQRKMIQGMIQREMNAESRPRGRATRAMLISVAIVLVAFLAAAPLACKEHAVHDTAAQIRVNQVGYEISTPMRAYLMTLTPQAEVRFAVKNGAGETAFSGAAGLSSGTWNKFTVYPLDFRLTTAGTYTISASGQLSASSPAFSVNAAGQLYAAPLANALHFFQNQRDGKDYIPSDLRTAPSHLNDEHGEVYRSPEFGMMGRVKGDLQPTGAKVDAAGGWWDAGDYLKFVHTTSYAEALMLVGVRDMPPQMGADSATSFLNEARFGLDWLQRMWRDDSATLYYQMGVGSGGVGGENDHSIWRLPQDDDNYGGTSKSGRFVRNRPVFVAGVAGAKVSPNLAGRLAADFALGSVVFRAGDPAYADKCLLAAERIFDLADTAPAGELLTASPHDFYDESEWRDDMELGAVELYLATRAGKLPQGLPHSDPAFYLKAAAEWASAYIHAEKGSGDILSVGDVSGLAHFELYRALELAGNPSRLALSTPDLLADLKKTLEKATAQSQKDPFGYGVPWGGGDTPTHGAALAVMASEYDDLTKSNEYDAYIRGWIANILGANAWGVSLIVGDGSTFPRCIHHQVANLLTSGNPLAPALAGAVVEGPIEKADSGAPSGAKACPANGEDVYSQFDGNGAMYRDNVAFYSTNEPAIDLTAPSFLMFAWRMATTQPTSAAH